MYIHTLIPQYMYIHVFTLQYMQIYMYVHVYLHVYSRLLNVIGTTCTCINCDFCAKV